MTCFGLLGGDHQVQQFPTIWD